MAQMQSVPPIPADFADLITNLEAQDEVYSQLIQLSDQEQVALRQGDLNALATIIASKEQLVLTAQHLEAVRVEACRRWSQARGDEHLPTLQEMHAQSSPTVAARLEAARVTLSQRVQRLRQINTRNAHLIAQAQRMNERSLAVALRYGHHPAYDARGDVAPTTPSGMLFDYQA